MNASLSPLRPSLRLVALLAGTLLLAHFSNSLAHEKLDLDPAQAYHLLPENMDAESHPSNQVGYRSEETTTTEHQNGSLQFLVPDQQTIEGTSSSKSVVNKTIEMLEGQVIRYSQSQQGQKTSLVLGQEYPETLPDPLAGQPLLIDLNSDLPTVSFEKEDKRPTAEQQSQFQSLAQEYQIHKTTNPWIPEQISYGKKPRTVGDTWSPSKEELEELSQWLSEIRNLDQGSYQMKSLEVEFLELKEIDHLPYAVLELRGEFLVETLSEEQKTQTKTEGSFTTRVERNLVTFVESAEMQSKAQFSLQSENENGNQMQEKSEVLMTIKENNSLPLEGHETH